MSRPADRPSAPVLLDPAAGGDGEMAIAFVGRPGIGKSHLTATAALGGVVYVDEMQTIDGPDPAVLEFLERHRSSFAVAGSTSPEGPAER